MGRSSLWTTFSCVISIANLSLISPNIALLIILYSNPQSRSKIASVQILKAVGLLILRKAFSRDFEEQINPRGQNHLLLLWDLGFLSDLVLPGDQEILALCFVGFQAQMLDLQKKKNIKYWHLTWVWAHLTQHNSSVTKALVLKTQKMRLKKNPRQGPKVYSKSIFCWLD